MELTTTKERVLEAAKEFPQTQGVLKSLFPEAFKKDAPKLVVNEKENTVIDQFEHIVIDFSFFGKHGKASLRPHNFIYEICGDMLIVTRK